MAAVDQVRAVSTIQQMLDAVGVSFYIVTQIPSQSPQNAGKRLNGTRVAMSFNPKDGGMNFFISTGISDERNDEYNSELTEAFADVSAGLMEVLAEEQSSPSGGGERAELWTPRKREKQVKLCLRYYFYWMNYTPLSRGSAAVGYAALVGCVLAMGEVLLRPLPPGIQMDWEAMFADGPDSFVDTAYKWMLDRQPAVQVLPQACLAPVPVSLDCSTVDAFNTSRAMLFAINRFYDKDRGVNDYALP